MADKVYVVYPKKDEERAIKYAKEVWGMVMANGLWGKEDEATKLIRS